MCGGTGVTSGAALAPTATHGTCGAAAGQWPEIRSPVAPSIEAVAAWCQPRSLPQRTREILRLRFEEDLTRQEIGERFGVSQMQISRVIRQTLSRLRGIAASTSRCSSSAKPRTPCSRLRGCVPVV
jgi:hypothetical protein